MYEYIYLLCAGVYHIVENIQDSKIIIVKLVKGRLFGKFWHAKILTLPDWCVFICQIGSNMWEVWLFTCKLEQNSLLEIFCQEDTVLHSLKGHCRISF